jgi:hypothetical protein
MKVAILGAPGAGKTKISKKLVNSLNKQGDLGQWKLIDGYVDKLRQRTNLPFGQVSTFAHNLAVITDRWVLEREAQEKGFHTVTCGSIYESIMYSTFATNFFSTQEDMMVYDQLFYKAMMEALGGLEARTYDYTAIFRLEWTVPLVTERGHTWEGVINEKLPEALDGFNKYAIPLTGTDKSKAQAAEEVIRAIWTFAEATNDDGGTVLSSDSDSQSEEH